MIETQPDPTKTNPDLYKVVLENERVRVLEYRDEPGDRTLPHHHPDGVMITLSGFQRRLTIGEQSMEVNVEPNKVMWHPAQIHSGENVGTTSTHVMFVEFK